MTAPLLRSVLVAIREGDVAMLLYSLSFAFGEVTMAGLLFPYYNKIIIKEALGSVFFDAKLKPHFSKIVR